MEDGLLSLKWNNHKSTFFHILSSLRKKETYTDATLACEGKFFPVHKFVMSTCSDYFCEIFENTNCKSPVVILKDIKHRDLEALLDYMYLGEVDVKQNELAGLIKAAECLRIKGLAVPDEDPALSPKKTHFPESRLSPSAKRARRETASETSSQTPPFSSQNHHCFSPPRSHSSIVSTSVPSQSVNAESLSQVPSLSVPPSYMDTRHSNVSPNDNQKHINQSDIVPIEMIKVEVDEESSNSQLQLSKDKTSSRSGSKEESNDGNIASNLDESHRDKESISNNFGEYSTEIQPPTDIEKEEHDQIDPFSDSDQVAGPSGVQGSSQIVNWGGEGSFPHNLFGNEDSSHQQVCIAIVEPEMLAVRMFQGSKPQYVNHSQLQLAQGEKILEREKTFGQPQDYQQITLSPTLHQHRGPESHYVVCHPQSQHTDHLQKKNSENLHPLEIIHSVPPSSIILSTPTISTSVVTSQIASSSLPQPLPTISVMTAEKSLSTATYKKHVSSKKNLKTKASTKAKTLGKQSGPRQRKSPYKNKRKPVSFINLKGNSKIVCEKIVPPGYENMPITANIDIPTSSVESRPEFGANVNTSQEQLSNKFTEAESSPNQQSKFSYQKKQDNGLGSDSTSTSCTPSPQDFSSRHHRLHFCPYCQYHSKSKVDLNKHIRIHTREKPYKCCLCKYETGDKSNFKRHLTCVHKCEYVSSFNSAADSHPSVVADQQFPQAANLNTDTSEKETILSETQEEQRQFTVILDPQQNSHERVALTDSEETLGYSSIEIDQRSSIEYSSTEIEEQKQQPPLSHPIPSMEVHTVEICSSLPYSHSITTTSAESPSSNP